MKLYHLIIFVAEQENGQTYFGRIIVHDRARVESEVLPRYFNHASFASLRRQLNYFSFTRIGKGRQRGATYCNEGVMKLSDILRLKRRTVGASSDTNQEDDQDYVTYTSTPESSNSIDAVVPVVHLPSPNKKARTEKYPKKPRPSKYQSHIVSSDSDKSKHFQPRISLDLTMPPTTHMRFSSYNQRHHTADSDIIAGCNVLLSFSNGASRPLASKT